MRERLIEVIHFLHSRGWAPGTGGNFSALISESPLRLLMSPSGYNKGGLVPSDLLVVDAAGRKIEGEGKPSAETLLHLIIARTTGAKSVLHTHSVWNTLLSDIYAVQGVLELSHYEMLKGLGGIQTHEHTERVPIVENSQDIPALTNKIDDLLKRQTNLHGILLRNHGLYTWGSSPEDAQRHVEIFEFLFEVVGRKLSLSHSHRSF
ncbi:MAG: methylthioribulose 1-phosphate dehydratase [bacterium]|nr:methylthioribulose 1-phosphate dehydratase [bacterium]